ncbi:ATP-dependent helicase HrpB [Oleispira antarctica RB-8]|uniref:ATP-dependent helicase HrpB n=1 Tax=Oleispira antarctica RB-8 TaxID=698738 RepID=R4YQ81_OLEAN|nr:ATP-dependent helicase HrpB [Oleispira antarctica RB-8]
MNSLPIDSILTELNQALSQNKNVILSAQPGAGKTTRVPLALLDADWLRNDDGSYKKIIMLEPRRLAARNAALFMAKSLNEAVGQTVGYRMRQDTNVSSNTRIEVITEGILTRYLLQDPELSNIGLIIFDEHHERSVNTDLGLALSLQCQQLFREDLKLLIMSATLDKDALENMLEAETLFCSGRAFPIEYHYLGFDTKSRLSNQMTDAIITALQQEDGSILAFLPGVRDIQFVQQQLMDKLTNTQLSKLSKLSANTSIHPLYGQLSDKEQQAAIQATEKGQRKIVLATNIAESSLTIEGIRIVIDSGLEKQLNYNARSGMNALITKKISQASSIQRAGRAGRIEPGVCYRLWSEQSQTGLEAHSPAEISRIELSDLVLNVAQWGAEIDELDWLTSPPARFIEQAQSLLSNLDLLDNKGQISPHGEQASQLGMSPRFAHMLLNADSKQHLNDVCLLAALLTDTPKALRNNDDLASLLQHVKAQPKSFSAIYRQALAWGKKINLNNSTSHNSKPQKNIPQLLALAFPDRIAQRRTSNSKESAQQYLLSSGRGAQLHFSSSLSREEWLIVTDIEDNLQGSSLIRKAMPISEADLLKIFSSHIQIRSHVEWNDKGQLEAEKREYLGALLISQKRLSSLSNEQWQDAWRNYFIDNGIKSLPWTDDHQQLIARLQLAFEYHSKLSDTATSHRSPWPDFSDEALLTDIESWLMPLLSQCHSQKALNKIDLKQALLNRLGWDKVNDFEALVPEKITVPSGSHYKIDYSQTPPILAVKLQEMFGYQGKPSICNGRIDLMLHLLSPARRPLQITQDLPYFWLNSYFDVRKEMRGKYPKHPWPENPLESEATRFTKHKKY